MYAESLTQIGKSKKELEESINTYVGAITNFRRDVSSSNDVLRSLIFILVICVTVDVERKQFRKRNWSLKRTFIPVF
jgi:hypothetical protein